MSFRVISVTDSNHLRDSQFNVFIISLDLDNGLPVDIYKSYVGAEDMDAEKNFCCRVIQKKKKEITYCLFNILFLYQTELSRLCALFSSSKLTPHKTQKYITVSKPNVLAHTHTHALKIHNNFIQFTCPIKTRSVALFSVFLHWKWKRL